MSRGSLAGLPRTLLLAACCLVAAAPAQAETRVSWWQSWQDDELQRWITLTLQHNPEIATGKLRVAAAELRLQQARERLLPLFSLALSGTRTAGDEATATTLGLTAGVQGEVDLWGRGRRGVQAETLARDAVAADEQALQLQLSTTAAEIYWQRLFTLEAWRQAQAALESAQHVERLVTLQRQVGKVSTLELVQAQASLQQQKLTLQALHGALQDNRRAALQLLGRAEEPSVLLPGTAPLGTGASAELPSEPPATPAPVTLTDLPPPALQTLSPDVLAQRDDLRAAAWRLDKLLRERDIAAAAHLPTLNLGMLLARSGATLLDVVRNPLASFAATLTLFEARGGERSLQRDLADNAYAQALLQYRTTLLSALYDVQAAAQRSTVLEAQVQTLKRLLQYRREAESIYALRYRVGAVELRVWLDAQDRLRAVERDLLDNRLAQHMSRLQWIRAIGGSTEAAP